MDKQTVFDKIKKCLALGASSNPHEAAAALRQAQKLMDMHGVTQADIDALGYSGETVEVPIQVNKKIVPLHLQHFINLIKKAFGVKLVISHNVRVSDTSYMIHYFGPTARVQMAAYAHVVLFRAMNGAWTKYLRENPDARGQRGARSSFFIGWIHGVSEKVEAIGYSDVERAATDIVLKAAYQSLVKTKSGKVQWDDEVAGAGVRAARDFDIHRPMNQDKLRLGNG
jgi:hypothetical protein